MTSEITADRLQPLVAEIREMREKMVAKADLANFATKADLANFATRADLANFATKADLANFATKADLADFVTKADLADFVTKADLARSEANLRREIAERDVRLIKWMFGALMAQAALIVALVVGFVSLLL